MHMSTRGYNVVKLNTKKLKYYHVFTISNSSIVCNSKLEKGPVISHHAKREPRSVTATRCRRSVGVPVLRETTVPWLIGRKKPITQKRGVQILHGQKVKHYKSELPTTPLRDNTQLVDTCTYVDDTCAYVDDTCVYVDDTCAHVDDTCAHVDDTCTSSVTLTRVAKVTKPKLDVLHNYCLERGEGHLKKLSLQINLNSNHLSNYWINHYQKTVFTRYQYFIIVQWHTKSWSKTLVKVSSNKVLNKNEGPNSLDIKILLRQYKCSYTTHYIITGRGILNRRILTRKTDIALITSLDSLLVPMDDQRVETMIYQVIHLNSM